MNMIRQQRKIIDRLAADSRSGDIVLILSNGGFEGIYERLPAAIEAAGPT